MTKINRRGLLAGAAAPLVVSPGVAFGSAANSAVSFGVLGTGGRGRYVGALMVKDARLAATAVSVR